MEDVVTRTLVKSATAVPFSEVERALAREGAKKPGTTLSARALTATVVAVGPRERLDDVAQPLSELAAAGAIRAIIIPEGTPPADAQVGPNVVVLPGLEDTFIDNAVASLRLASLPTLIWWRGGPMPLLDSLITLAERVVLDADPPEDGWRCAVSRFERAAFSDFRWTRLTRWRAMMAQFFDLPDVREAAPSLTRLRIDASDRPSAELFAAWMRTALQWGNDMTIDIHESRSTSPISCITLSGGAQDLNLRVAKTRTCLESAVKSGAQTLSGVVGLGDESLTALLSDELRIRSRDHAFERALRALVAA